MLMNPNNPEQISGITIAIDELAGTIPPGIDSEDHAITTVLMTLVPSSMKWAIVSVNDMSCV